MLSANPFTATVSGASVALAHLSTLLAPIGGAAIAIVVITLIVRLALHPLTRAAVRGERARARLAPKVAELRRKHGKDVTQLSQQMSALYKDEQISPFAGLGPMLVQAPVFLVLYRVFTRSGGGLAGANLFGTPLTDRFLTSMGGLGAHVLVFVALFAVLAAVSLVTSRRSAMIVKINNANTQVGTAGADTTAIPASAVATIGRVAPFLVLISATIVPLAAGLYLVTSTAWSAAENALLRRGLPA